MKRLLLSLVWGVAWPWLALGFPPVPPHEIYGILRDELGQPMTGGALVVFETPGGLVREAPVGERTVGDANYRLSIPMEAGLSRLVTAATAVRPYAGFRLRVRIGTSSYVPIEMTGNLRTLGVSGGRTRLDLTLGEDTDGNGLPDAWERDLARRLGLAWAPGAFSSDGRVPGSGLSFQEMYLAGTYATDPEEEGYRLEIDRGSGNGPVMAFTSVQGRSYWLETAVHPGEWTRIPFRLMATEFGSEPVTRYRAVETRRIEIAAPETFDDPHRMYRLRVE